MRVSSPKVLITTPYRKGRNDYFDPASANFVWAPHLAMPRTVSPGLRFLKQNVPEVEILEFPRWETYKARLAEGWDAVGFSFFQQDIPKVLEMAQEARRQGVDEIWAGGYGALWEGTRTFADRVFRGYAEEEVGRVFGREVTELRHPPVIVPLQIHGPPRLPIKPLGWLFTQRGCANRCTFCQSPSFAPDPHRIPLQSVEEILRYYRKVGVDEVWVFDETFYTFPEHSEAVIDLLQKYGFYWWVQSRADLSLVHLANWRKRGLAALAFGLESPRDAVLDTIGKSTRAETWFALKRRTRELDVTSLAYVMIGYADDTIRSVLEDYRALLRLSFDMVQLAVVTPFPATVFRQEVEQKYGLREGDWEHYGGRHLVWNHPHIAPAEMRALLLLGMALLNVPYTNYGRGMVLQLLRRIRTLKHRYLAEVVAGLLHSLEHPGRDVRLP